MSTIGYESWAVDLAEVGAIYPFQGWETPMVIIGVIFWIGWHVIQHRRETAEFEAAKRAGSAESISAAVDRY